MGSNHGSRKLIYILLVFLLLVVAGFLLRRTLDAHLRAAAVLTRLNDPDAHRFIAGFAAHPIREEDGSALISTGPLRYKMYIPDGSARGCIVLLHGVHHLGLYCARHQSVEKRVVDEVR